MASPLLKSLLALPVLLICSDAAQAQPAPAQPIQQQTTVTPVPVTPDTGYAYPNRSGFHHLNQADDGYRETTTVTLPNGEKTRVIRDVDRNDDTTTIKTKVIGPNDERGPVTRTVIENK